LLKTGKAVIQHLSEIIYAISELPHFLR